MVCAVADLAGAFACGDDPVCARHLVTLPRAKRRARIKKRQEYCGMKYAQRWHAAQNKSVDLSERPNAAPLLVKAQAKIGTNLKFVPICFSTREV